MNPFDIVKNINEKGPLLTEQDVTGSMYIVTKALSYFVDTLFLANEMNGARYTTDIMKYHFYYYSIDKGKRFRKWEKKEKELEEKIGKLQRYTNYNRYRVKELIPLVNELGLWNEIEKEIQTGGLTK